MWDEQITRAVAENIWKGDLRNNWKYAANMSAAFHIDCYNFSSYMYVDALPAGRHSAHPLFREHIFSAALGTLAAILFYLVELRYLACAWLSQHLQSHPCFHSSYRMLISRVRKHSSHSYAGSYISVR